MASSPHFNIQCSSLRDSALAPATLRTYTINLQSFLQFAHLSMSSFLSISPRTVDHRLAEYIESLHSLGRPFDYASHTVNGVVFRRPELRLKLGESRLRLRGWQRTRRTQSHPPLT